MDIEEKLWVGATVFAALWMLLLRTARNDPALYWRLEYTFAPLVALYAAGALVMGALVGRTAGPEHMGDARTIGEFMQVTSLVLVALLISRGFLRTVARMPPLDAKADRTALERDRPRFRLRR